MLVGRRALVTGSVQGIGLAVARELAEAGAEVVLHGLPDAATHDAARSALAPFSEHAIRSLAHDLSDKAQVERMMAEALADGPLDILVNNAGIQYTAPLLEMPRDKWDAILAVNLSAAFDTMRMALPGMISAGYGRIVNIASVHGLVASVHKAPYVAAKFGLIGLTRVVALEAAQAGNRASGGVTANCICPGWTETAIIEPQVQARAGLFGGDREAGIRDLLREKQPSGRTSTPQEIGRIAVWLCETMAHNITGAAIPVDGGWTAQ
jgi:3-hydroxybutyrate dehydrogenase